MKNALLLITALITGSAWTETAGAATGQPTTLPAKKIVKKKLRAKARKRIRKQSELTEVDVPPGKTIALPALATKDRATKSFQRATTPISGGVVMRSMSKAEYAEYAAVADREAEAAERIQRKKIAPPLPVEKIVIDDLEKQILAEVNDTAPPKPAVEAPSAPASVEAPAPIASQPEPVVDEIPVPDDAILIGAYEVETTPIAATQLETPSVQKEIESELGLDTVDTEAMELAE